MSSSSGYSYASAEAEHTSAYLWKPILARCHEFKARRILDLGCGNGAFCRELIKEGFSVVGCDPSSEGIYQARQAIPEGTFKQIGVDDDPALLGETGFDVVISTEVVEHLPTPVNLPRFAYQVLRPGGRLVVSTPYHGYLKNMLLSVTNQWDGHFTPFWDGGHIKFWSRTTLTQLLEREHFRVTGFAGAGRFPCLWKSMILTAVKS